MLNHYFGQRNQTSDRNKPGKGLCWSWIQILKEKSSKVTHLTEAVEAVARNKSEFKRKSNGRQLQHLIAL